MRKNIAKVIDAFQRGVAAKGDSKGTCSTDGNVIYSYAMPIARRIKFGRDEMIVLIPYNHAPTNTTRSQVRAVESAYTDSDLVRLPTMFLDQNALTEDYDAALVWWCGEHGQPPKEEFEHAHTREDLYKSVRALLAGERKPVSPGDLAVIAYKTSIPPRSPFPMR